MNRQQRPITDRELKAWLAAGPVDRGSDENAWPLRAQATVVSGDQREFVVADGGGVAEAEPQHLAIVTPYRHGGLAMIHAYSRSSAVVEHRLADVWRARIVAAGDCTARRLADGSLLRLESVQNATEQGKSAAAALLGQERRQSPAVRARAVHQRRAARDQR